MNSCIAYDFYKLLDKDSFAMLYGGRFNDNVLINSTEIVKKIISDDIRFEKFKNKMIFLMIEAFQNVIRYAEIDSSEHTDLLGKFFITRRVNGEIFVATSNIVENYKKNKIKEKIERINNLDGVSLKKKIIDVLTNRQFSDKGGAGLGFIEMSRKTKTKLIYDFVTINDDLSHFYFLTKLKYNEISVSQNLSNIDLYKNLHSTVSKEKILLMLKNDFKEDMIAAVLSVVEQNLKVIEMKYHKKIFHLLVESIQNISKHAAIREGKRHAIVLISKDEQAYFISTGNLVKNQDVDKFKTLLVNLKNMSKKELSSIYVSKLIDETSEKIGGIGIIDIIREAESFYYNFIEIDEIFSFFAFKIKININD